MGPVGYLAAGSQEVDCQGEGSYEGNGDENLEALCHGQDGYPSRLSESALVLMDDIEHGSTHLTLLASAFG